MTRTPPTAGSQAVPSPESYLAAVAAALGRHARAHADDLAELDALLAEHCDDETILVQLGPAQDYAAALLGAGEDSGSDGETRFLGLPVGLDLSGLPARAARGFDPEAPLFVPRAWGVGWDLNLGALAVRLHLVAPDDLGEDLEPGPALATATATIPVLLAGAVHIGARCAATRRAARATSVAPGPHTACAAPAACSASASPTASAAASSLPPLLVAAGLALYDAATHASFPRRLGHAVAATALTGVGAAATAQAALADAHVPRAARLIPSALTAATALAAAGAGALAVRLAVRRTMSPTARPQARRSTRASTQEPA